MNVTTVTTDDNNALLEGVRAVLENADEALLAVAFVKRAGVNLIEPQLKRLGSAARLVLTTTFSSDSESLGAVCRLKASVNILNASSGTNHAKIYLGRRGSKASALIGSCNLTGGLVSNIEAAVLLEGSASDPPIRDAWEFGERLWSHNRSYAWSPTEISQAAEEFRPELFAAIRSAVWERNGLFPTLAHGKPNLVTEVTPTGLYVATEATEIKRIRPQLVPAWMIELAWDYLHAHGRLTNRFLLATDGLNVKRSSLVCAILARLPGIKGVVAKGEGIVLELSIAS